MTGPGCFDMKYGDMQALWALRLVMESGAARDKTFVFLGNADEEVGSPTSRPIIERLARESESVLVLEPSVGADGAVKLWRKGIGVYHLDIEGVASHAGADPEKGRIVFASKSNAMNGGRCHQQHHRQRDSAEAGGMNILEYRG